MIQRVLALFALAFLPLVSSAQSLNFSPIATLINAVAKIIGALVPVLVTLALVVFLWGLVRYLWGGAAKADLQSAKRLMGWGLIILFVMVSVWGIVALMQEALSINKNASGKAPQIQYSGSTGSGAPQMYNI